jgi:gamma-glutamyl-gamma-aminobutyrate hydrolase PuuD
MKKSIIFTIAILSLASSITCIDYTGLPLIGIIAIPASNTLNNEYYNAQSYWSYIPKSYTSYIGQTAAMPLLIPYDLPLETLNHLLENV